MTAPVTGAQQQADARWTGRRRCGAMSDGPTRQPARASLARPAACQPLLHTQQLRQLCAGKHHRLCCRGDAKTQATGHQTRARQLHFSPQTRTATRAARQLSFWRHARRRWPAEQTVGRRTWTTENPAPQTRATGRGCPPVRATVPRRHHPRRRRGAQGAWRRHLEAPAAVATSHGPARQGGGPASTARGARHPWAGAHDA